MKFADLNIHTPINTIYLELYNVTHHILDEQLHYFSQHEDSSVDVYKLASNYGFKIYEEYIPPSTETHKEIWGCIKMQPTKRIYLNTATGNLTRRYTTAYFLSYYLFHEHLNTEPVHYFIHPDLPDNFQEQLYHLFASFLLMPVSSVIKLLTQYTAEQPISDITFHSWLNCLGNTMRLPTYYTAAAFENVRILHALLIENHIEII